ncbi:hypothetical protein HOP52_04210 [Halomonas campisalis]|uniref:ChrR-like cupin domain-containing protein n=1 Tax=Billgrantia campisalis TaxID=74661 RepID=A0ABS9P5V2_9GAMM|nr:cupin domain-containing protein [Halomonas campisalis]MCG6656981.1 hypothetical protein [Halomonas campisalis]MDR5862168.1 cupin domain-containing protein [Halomonas campisalis]
MTSASEETTIIREPADWLPVELPGTQGISIKVYHVDKVNHNVIVKFRFAPGGYGARHVHHCRAIGYTLSGEWAYDDGSFEEGDAAYELIGNNHYPYSDKGGELIVFMDAV